MAFCCIAASNEDCQSAPGTPVPKKGAKKLQGAAPPVVSWFITPIKYRYIYHKSKLLELQTNLATYGAPPCINLHSILV